MSNIFREGFEFADVTKEPLKPKASIHKTGKLGFNSDAAELMSLRSGLPFSVAVGADGATKEIALVPYKDSHPKKSRIEVAKAGDYYYLNLRNFFDLREVPYEQYRIVYDIDEIKIMGVEGFLLEGREEPVKRD
jgi:hypothetical protein